mmetsp:Transcript_27906/g.64335  ORF Transcript_27906/g.64335 Transcript_27906/m.64335 type:complete len:369 (-) Transcript_27906:216-1322(-)
MSTYSEMTTRTSAREWQTSAGVAAVLVRHPGWGKHQVSRRVLERRQHWVHQPARQDPTRPRARQAARAARQGATTTQARPRLEAPTTATTALARTTTTWRKFSRSRSWRLATSLRGVPNALLLAASLLPTASNTTVLFRCATRPALALARRSSLHRTSYSLLPGGSLYLRPKLRMGRLWSTSKGYWLTRTAWRGASIKRPQRFPTSITLTTSGSRCSERRRGASPHSWTTQQSAVSMAPNAAMHKSRLNFLRLRSSRRLTRSRRSGGKRRKPRCTLVPWSRLARTTRHSRGAGSACDGSKRSRMSSSSTTIPGSSGPQLGQSCHLSSRQGVCVQNPRGASHRPRFACENSSSRHNSSSLGTTSTSPSM